MGFDTIPCEHMKLREGSRYPSLWLPRFDVAYIEGQKALYGLESVYSILQKPPGSYLNHFEVIRTLIKRLNPERAAQERFVIEWVKRDMLNIAFGNSDNHGRNSAILKQNTGMWLAPIYDFAPMKADPEGVVRTTQWGSPFEEGGHYQWQLIAEALDDLISSDRLLAELAALARQLTGLRERLQQRGVPASILTMPAMGFDYLDQRIEGWQL